MAAEVTIQKDGEQTVITVEKVLVVTGGSQHRGNRRKLGLETQRVLFQLRLWRTAVPGLCIGDVVATPLRTRYQRGKLRWSILPDMKQLRY